MEDMTDQNPEENKLKAGIIRSQAEVVEARAEKTDAEAKQADAEARKANAKARKTEAETNLANARFKGRRSLLKRLVVSAGIGSVLVGGSVIAYNAGKGVKDSVNKHPDTIEKAVSGATDGIFDTVEASGNTVKSLGEAVKTTADTFDQFISRPELNQFLTRIKGTIAFPGIRGNQASDWNTEHPDMPMTKDQLVAILKAQDNFLKKEGRAMTVKEVNKAAQRICGWKKVSPQIQKARQKGGR